MKPGILIVGLVAMALAIVATPDTHAKAWGGWHGSHGFTLKLAGSSFSVTQNPDGTAKSVPPFSAVQNGIARGKYGRALLSSTTFAGEFAPAREGECPETLPLQGLLTVTFVLTYNDGSILSGVTGPGNYYCTDGTTFSAQFAGTLTGGERRFEGATGTWETDATIMSSRLTGELEIDID